MDMPLLGVPSFDLTSLEISFDLALVPPFFFHLAFFSSNKSVKTMSEGQLDWLFMLMELWLWKEFSVWLTGGSPGD